MQKKTIAIFGMVTAIVAASPGPAPAQFSSRIQFEAGSDNAAISGTITGREYRDYVLRARAGQTMAVALTVDGTNGSGSAFFNILPPGSDNVAVHIGSMDDDSFASVELPENGNYTIRVYLMGNDASTHKTTSFTVSVTIR